MLSPSAETWRSWNIVNEIQMLFILRWREIFSEQTLDSWQVQFSNSISILDEIEDCIQIVRGNPRSHGNIKNLIDELESVASNDLVITKFYPAVRQGVHNLKSAYEQQIKPKDKDCYKFERSVRVLRGTMGAYLTIIKRELQQLLTRDWGEESLPKSDIDALTMALGVELSRNGYSLQALAEGWKVFTDTEKSFNEKLSSFFDHFDCQMSSFSCRFIISWSGAVPDTKQPIQIINERSTNDEDKCPKFYRQNKSAPIAEITVSALDPFGAYHKSRQKLESLFSASRIYLVSKQLSVIAEKTLITSDNGDSACVAVDNSRLGYIRDARKSADLISQILHIINRLSDHEQGQFGASLNYHKLFTEASSDDARLVNLWVALESLIQNGKGSIIERICRYVPVSHCTNYAYRIAKSIPIEMKGVWKNSDTSELVGMLEKSSRYILNPHDLFSILLDEKEGDKIESFYSIIGEHVLLKFRIYNLRKWLKSGSGVFANTIKAHKNKIDWQVRRIYMARNSIMHRGIAPRGIRQLIQHLHSYYIILLHNLVHDLSRHDEWGIGDALEYRNFLYETAVHNLTDKNLKTNVSREQLVNFELFLKKNNNSPAWN